MPNDQAAAPAEHVIIPWAGPREPFSAGHLPALPQLSRLLALAGGGAALHIEASPGHLNTPDEWLRMQRCGWPAPADGLCPLAAHAALVALGPAQVPAGSGWAFITPAHARVSAEAVTLEDPAALQLSDADAHALVEAAAALLPDGAALHVWQPHCWLLQDVRLAHSPTASLARAIGQRVDDWQSPVSQAGWLRRWQAEVQMAWHAHAVNARRDSQRLPVVNTLWISGSGARPQVPPGTDAAHWELSLQAPTLAQDEAGWVDAWARLDAGLIAAALARVQAGQPLTLTLTGEAATVCVSIAARGWIAQRVAGWRAPRLDARAVLQSLS